MSDPREATCNKFDCATWEGRTRIEPKLVKRGKFWCCPKCGGSYGSDEDFAVGFDPFENDAVP